MGRRDSQSNLLAGRWSFRGFGLRSVLVSVVFALMAGAAVVPAVASASERGALVGDPGPPAKTVWLCKPGIADNPCLEEDLDGTRYDPSQEGTPSLGYRPARKPGFTCFYIYPTQSTQPSLNADYSRDQELKAVAINQAAQFSRICDVYAPVYRQYTNQALGQLETLGDSGVAEIRDIAYEGVLSAFRDFVANDSKGRGFVLLGHSQGASHLSRLIDEEIDPVPALRRRMISAIVPGSNNIYVPKGEVIGGNLENVPACTEGDQLGCVMAWSIYLERAGTGLPANANFGRLGAGYWVYPDPRPDPKEFEVLCVNPSDLSGADQGTTVLANLPALLGSLGRPQPWNEFRGYYRTECLTGEDASWLDMSPIPDVPPPFLDGLLRTQINSNLGGLHTGDINLVLGDLIEIAGRQGSRYVNWRNAVKRSKATERALVRSRAALRKATRKARKARSACRSARIKSSCRKARSAEGQRKRVRKKVKRLVIASKKAAAEIEAYAPD
jgi:hypothetical protein